LRICGLAILSLAAFVVSAHSESLPRLEGETLSGKQIVLPDDAHGKIALLVIGFTKKGGQATDAWGKRFKKDFGTDQRYVVYPVAVLEEVPRFIRGIVTSGMRRGVAPGEQDRFVTLFQGEAGLKHFVAYSTPDEPYLLLLDADGKVQWHGHGLFREQDYPALRDAAKQLALP
jgi:ATP10 protein